MADAKQFRVSLVIVAIVLLSLIWAVVFALDLLPILHGGPPDWDWHFRPVLERYRIGPLILGLIIYVPLGLRLRQLRSVGPLLIWGILGGIGLSLAAVHARGDILYRLYSITVSGRAAGWHMAAAQIQDLRATLQDWPGFMTQSLTYSAHIDHSPPGIVIVYFAVGRLLDSVPTLAAFLAQPLRWLLCQYLIGYTNGQYASAWLGMLMPLWTSLTIIPLYSLGRRVYGEESARWAVLWWPLVPGALIFAPLPNTFYALPALAVIGLLWKGLVEDRMVVVVAAGILMSVLTFLTFTFAPLLLLAGLLTLGAYWLRIGAGFSVRLTWHWPIRVGLCFGLGLGIVWLIYLATTGSSFWGMWQAAQQTQQAVAGVRPYLPWLPLNLNDLFMFTGWPLALLALIGVWTAIRRIRSRQAPVAGDVMTLAAALTFITIDLYGTPRGEWGRILLFFSPWILLAAASQLRETPAGAWPITGLQAITAIIVIACLQVLAPEFKGRAAPVPPPVKFAASNPPVHTSGAVFDENVRLFSYSGQTGAQRDEDGKEQTFLFMWLTWDTLKPMDIPYAYRVRPIATNGTQSGAPAILTPFADVYPTTCWKPDESQLTDRIKVPLSGSGGADWWAEFALVDPGSGEVLDVTTPDGLLNQYLKLGPFR